MGKKVIFIDVDGTLVNYENQLPVSAAEAIRAARRAGHKVYICTGRSRAEVYNVIWEIGLDGMIGGNGSYVEDHGNVLMHRRITSEQCRRIVDWLHGRGLEFYLECNSGLYASEHFKEEAPSAIREYGRRKGQQEPFAVSDVYPDMIYGADLYREDVNKVSYLLHDWQDYVETRAQFPDLANGTWGGAGETALFGDLGVKGITKAHAIEVLLDHLGCDRADTVAFGDAGVDIPMLEYCGTGVAMGNGSEEIRRIADYVTDDVDRDGLAKAFVHLGLNS